MSPRVVFIVTCYTTTITHHKLLLTCIQSISDYHPDAAIQVLDDNHALAECVPVPSFCRVEKTIHQGCGEVNAYLWAISHQSEYDHFIYIHDSCKLINRIAYRLDNRHFKPFWYASINSHFDTIGSTIDSIMECVRVHDKPCLDKLDTVRKGNGNIVFGAMAAFDIQFIKFLDQDTNFKEIAGKLKGRALRCFFERLLYILVWLFLDDDKFYQNSYCGDIYNHPNVFQNTVSDIDPNNKYIIKIWQGR